MILFFHVHVLYIIIIATIFVREKNSFYRFTYDDDVGICCIAHCVPQWIMIVVVEKLFFHFENLSSFVGVQLYRSYERWTNFIFVV